VDGQSAAHDAAGPTTGFERNIEEPEKTSELDPGRDQNPEAIGTEEG
jgi:hypothetical protein